MNLEQTPKNKMSMFEGKIRELQSVTDKLEMPIDSGIIETVALLNLFGLPTTGSCEGHEEGSGNGFPYVWIYEPEPRFGTEEEKVKLIENRNLQHQQNTRNLLNEFYRNRASDKNLKIRMLLLARNSIYLTCEGRKDVGYQKPSLSQLQNEFKDFTDFLKGKYINA